MRPLQQGFRYMSPDGSLTMLGLELFGEMQRRIEAQDAKLAAIAAVVAPTGGATVDAEARAAIAAIIAGAA
jgi:hypothetical protein